jgi:hypothetical protein
MKPRLFLLYEARHLAGLVAFLTSNWKQFADDGKALAVQVAIHKDRRTPEQNRRHFAMLGEIADQAWIGGRQYDKDVWHDYFCRKFIGEIELPGGKTMAMPSSRLNIEEFSKFMDQTEAYAAQELGVQFM